ncbi:berberine bridge enzyme-like D-2 [Salvia miltiorrhiza]|uniref:berberine bridge enzyme-like D-2 n=1 Tax=Salvia miltiorrhiza TaxID=226208 RepID=UPI0025ABDB29|nr:berberine bridge enzyme-like D-2 [Salvia miltiorrhiza]
MNMLFPLIIFMQILARALSHESVDVLESCLLDHSVFNFSLHPNSGNDPNTYLSLLDFSIQNLRFAGAEAPKPAAIVMPESRRQLVAAVVCCRLGSWEIRVRSGGHSYEGTSYMAGDGRAFVVIDMMNLDRVSVDLEAEVAWVEGGATLGQTYFSISESSRSHGFSAGSCPTVGVGGHVGGGGFGLLSRKYGLAADNVADALLVDAEGRVLDRAGMGEDVFWAIRGGGGGNWGVVYAWKVRLSRVPERVTGFIVSRAGSEARMLNLVNRWQHVAPELDDGFYLSSFLGASLPEAKAPGITATFKGFYLGSKEETLMILNETFPELEISEGECSEMGWIESVLYFSGLEIGSPISSLKDRFLKSKNYFKGKSDYVRAPIPINGIKSLIKILLKEPKGYVILDPYGGAMHKISSESIAFPHRKGNIFTIQYLVDWDEVDNGKSQDYIAWIRGLYTAMAPFVSSEPRAAYVNYMDLDLGFEGMMSVEVDDDAVEVARTWGEKYFLKNYDRLVRAKTKIDPLNVFRNQQGIPPMPPSASKQM